MTVTKDILCMLPKYIFRHSFISPLGQKMPQSVLPVSYSLNCIFCGFKMVGNQIFTKFYLLIGFSISADKLIGLENIVHLDSWKRLIRPWICDTIEYKSMRYEAVWTVAGGGQWQEQRSQGGGRCCSRVGWPSYTSEHIHWHGLDMGRMGNVFMVMSPNQLYNHGEGPY